MLTTTLTASQFKSLLSTVKPCASNFTQPLQRSVLIKVTSHQTSFSSFDTIKGVTHTIQVKSPQEFECLVPFTLVSNIAKCIKETISFSFESPFFKVKVDGYNFVVPTLNLEEYLRIPDFKAFNEPLPFNVKTNLNVLQKVCSVANTRATNAALASVLFNYTKESGNEAVATDSHRMIVGKLEGTQIVDSFLLDSLSLDAICRIFADAVNVTYQLSEGCILFNSEKGISFFSRLVNASYPKYELLFSPSFPISLKLDGAKFLEALKFANVSCCTLVHCSITPSSIKLSFKGDSDESNVAIDCACTQDFDAINAGFNTLYLQNALSASELSIAFKGSLSSFMINGERYKYLLMPIQIR